jgi:alpha-L-rhamnosidase
MVGWCRLKFKGPSGFGTYIRYGEVLVQPRMTFFISFVFILFCVLFSFTIHGFRYMSIFGPPNRLTADDVECPFVHSETTLKGNFTSSNPIINQIQHNILWTQLGNSMSLPSGWYV